MKLKIESLKQIDWIDAVTYKSQYNYSGSALLTGSIEQSEFSLYGWDLVEEIQYTDNDCVWEALNKEISKYDFSQLQYPANRCGWIGYLSYDLGRFIEKLPCNTIFSYRIPQASLRLFKNYIYWDNAKKQCWEITFALPGQLKEDLYHESEKFQLGNINQECSQVEYEEKVRKIQDYILTGDVYEVNLTQQFIASFSGSEWGFFKKLYEKNPAPFSAFLDYNDFKIASISPEGFLRCEQNEVLTKPIKGTAPRGRNPFEDTSNKEGLLSSKKDLAELHMIVDLMRNDLSKISEIGSVEVIDPNHLEIFSNVFHLVGIVRSRLKKDNSLIELIKACFPGGSITGCPKIASMKVIEELETYRRNLYTGSILVINNIFLQSNIVIRTGLIKDKKLFVNSGGAVTIDSDPASEYQEILHKIRTFLDI
jgi:para-aminobenzoate synthetase component 1